MKPVVLLSALLIPGALSDHCQCARLMENGNTIISTMPFGDGIIQQNSPVYSSDGKVKLNYCAIAYNRSGKKKERLACGNWYMTSNATGKNCDGKIGPVGCVVVP
ncbi:uncharacterized protein RAG0_12814 [Rhynchosporium agropyri]|uniref:Uncharacterized protein n=1 Tax=Rhynchosporium agropyri TaxID=914238 RepID=A0A1E1L9Q0_9HELO|nr:uncharacterized protein RAG0_12814 [Rhynchosporium agropyri]